MRRTIAGWKGRNRSFTAGVAVGFILTGQVNAQSDPTPVAPSKSAPKLVREANELLRSDKAAEALSAYDEAAKLRPDAREIAFDQALARYRLGEFDQAREAFNRAATGASDALADDAVYGMGAIDHAQALAATDPKEALSHVENAMRNYQTVLGNHPDHSAARDANLKAASYWRQLKQQMQQQQQQQQQDQQNQDQKEEQQEEQQQQEQQSQEKQEQQQQQESRSQQEQEQEQEQQQQQNEQQEQKEQKEQKEQQAQAEKEDDSQEQAERKLREMVQAMRDRKKHRKEDTRPPAFRPAEKDW